MKQLQANQICCPLEKCEMPFDSEKYLALKSEESEDKAHDIIQEGSNNFEISPTNACCLILCPTPNCGFQIEWRESTRENKNFECKNCHKLICANCVVPWHTDLTCQEYILSMKDLGLEDPDKPFDLDHMVERICPRCNCMVESQIGIDHMTCSKCTHVFCPKCLNKYKTCLCRFTTTMKDNANNNNSKIEYSVSKDYDYDYAG